MKISVIFAITISMLCASSYSDESKSEGGSWFGSSDAMGVLDATTGLAK